jgi:hypothetical protein
MARNKVMLLGGSLTALAVTASVAVASGATSSTPTRHAVPPHLGMKPLGHMHAPGQAAGNASASRAHARSGKIDRALVDKFALLRHARSSAQVADASGHGENTISAAIAPLSYLHKSYGADPSRAGETTIGAGQDNVWLVPGSVGACLVDLVGPQGAGSTCNSASAVEAGDLWTLDTIPYGAGGARTKVLIGTAPDGNPSVTIRWAGGGSTVVPVTDNIYSAPIGSHTGWSTVTLTNSSGDTTTVAGMSHLP